MLLAVGGRRSKSRLVYLQVVRYDDLRRAPSGSSRAPIEAPAKRGEILDRHGHILAYSVDADTIYAVPNEIADLEVTTAALCAARSATATRRIGRRMADRIRNGKHFAYVRRQVSPEQARRVAALQLDGIGFIKESRRYYPNTDLASHVLGYVGIDNVGLGGIEATYDNLDHAAAPARCSCRPTRGGRRSAASSGRRPRARRSS